MGLGRGRRFGCWWGLRSFVVCGAVGDQLFAAGGEFEEAAGAGAGEDSAGGVDGDGGVDQSGALLDVCLSLPRDGAEWDGFAGGVGCLVFAGDAGGGFWDVWVLSGEGFPRDSRGVKEWARFVCGWSALRSKYFRRD
jgi:hypothetical protein